MNRIYPDGENKRLTERRRGFMQVKIIPKTSNDCFICKNPQNIISCKSCSKSFCDNCRIDNMCIICDDSDGISTYQYCMNRCFTFR